MQRESQAYPASTCPRTKDQSIGSGQGEVSFAFLRATIGAHFGQMFAVNWRTIGSRPHLRAVPASGLTSRLIRVMKDIEPRAP